MNRIELHYHTGGHGGPYADTGEAVARAVALLKGSPTERTIDLRDGVNGPFVASVSKTQDDDVFSVQLRSGMSYCIRR